jgi:hypothetical protein
LSGSGFGRLGSAEGYAVAARSDGADSFVIDLRESAWVKGEGDVFGFAWSQVDAGIAVESEFG